jgi:hypothetical protein
LTATKLTPTVDTLMKNAAGATVSSAPIGSTVHDVATVSGSQGTPTGSVTFTLYSGNSTCQGEGVTSAGVALTAGSASSGTATVPVGGLSYIAHYVDDATYTPADGVCEALRATLVTPSISTTPNPGEATVGTTR